MIADTPSIASRAASTGSISVADIFTIGIGPSSSHTVGPMRAARVFADLALARGTPAEIDCELFGSLALTGRGHATDTAILLGLSGYRPESVDPDSIQTITDAIRNNRKLLLGGRAAIRFLEAENLRFCKTTFLAGHPNAMRFIARFRDGAVLERCAYSVGGGEIVFDGEPRPLTNIELTHEFGSAAELLAIARETGLTIAELVQRNERAWREDDETTAFLDSVRDAMFASIERGCRSEGVLPGGLNVRRRAKTLHHQLLAQSASVDPSLIFQWVSLYALAVNEENAGGGRVVTAPTNGAAGVLPAVLKYYQTFVPGATLAGTRVFLLTCAAIGSLYKKRASISAAEMGCQGEVGVACSMAAAGLAAALDASNEQVENAAEIGMEHNLGLTCDPVGGLVQIPCIERNTMGAIKAINAAYLALRGDGQHLVSLDAVIETMRQTGEDMRSKYKETSLGGLAVNVVAC